MGSNTQTTDSIVEEKEPISNNATETTTNGTEKAGFVEKKQEVKAEETMPGWTIMRPLKKKFGKGRTSGTASPDVRSDDDLLSEPEGVASGSTEGAGELAGDSTEVFKVYKRRWFGLVQLVLLNIVVSWDVRLSNALLMMTALLIKISNSGLPSPHLPRLFPSTTMSPKQLSTG